MSTGLGEGTTTPGWEGGCGEREAPVVGVPSGQEDELPVSFFSYILWASCLAPLVPTSELNNFGPCGQVSVAPTACVLWSLVTLVSLNPAALNFVTFP